MKPGMMTHQSGPDGMALTKPTETSTELDAGPSVGANADQNAHGSPLQAEVATKLAALT